MKRKTNFDKYLETQLKDQDFAERFKKAGNAWEIALQIAALRKEAGISQKELARRLGTSQQQVSRLESPSYEGHSLSMLRRVAEVLGATVQVKIQRKTDMLSLKMMQNMVNKNIAMNKKLFTYLWTFLHL